MLSVYRDHGVVRKDSRDDNFNKTAENRDIYQLVHPGWLVVNRMKAWQGSLGVSFLRGIVSGHYLCFRPSHDEEPRFLNYLLRSDVYRTELLRLSRGVRPNQLEIDNDLLRTVPVCFPDRDQQRRIASFLDAETERIDELIHTKKRMIAVLGEHRRRALSTRFGAAVTDRDMPSGPDRVTRLGYVSEISGGLTLGKQYDVPTETYPYLRVANVQDGELDLSEVKRVAVPPVEAQRFALRAGDVLVLEGNGNPENLGRGVMWRAEIEGTVLHQNHVHATRPDPTVLLPDYLEAVLGTEWARHYLTGGSSQVSIATLSQERLASLPISLPSLVQQRELLRWWRAESQRIDELVTTLQHQLELLRERRRSLIAAAVTGKMEVT